MALSCGCSFCQDFSLPSHCGQHVIWSPVMDVLLGTDVSDSPPGREKGAGVWTASLDLHCWALQGCLRGEPPVCGWLSSFHCGSFPISDRAGRACVGFPALTSEPWLAAVESRTLRANELLGEKTAYRIISLNDLTDVCGFLFLLVLRSF